jgi:polyisoprenoid-binding protein YceI
MKSSWCKMAVGGFAAIVCALGATAARFDFKDPKGVNTVVFTLDAPLEAISGSANAISGEVEFDPENPAATRGRIVVGTSSLHVPNPTMKEHLHGRDWMDVGNHPTLTFETTSVENVKTVENVTTADVTGKLTIKGVTRTVTVPVKMTHLKDKLAARTNGMMKGDLLVLRASFSVRRTDFEINPRAPSDKVADEIQLTLSVAGAAPRS